MHEVLSDFVHIKLFGMGEVLLTFINFFLFIRTRAIIIIKCLICVPSISQAINVLYCYFSRQCCKAFGISQYYVFIYLVDYWILLGISWWSNFISRFSSALLVCPLSLSHSNCSNILSVRFIKLLASQLMFTYFSYGFDKICMLRRLCIIFLGFDVFFVVFCVALACIIGIAVCCCLPCIIALLYAVADQVTYSFVSQTLIGLATLCVILVQKLIGTNDF